MYGLDPFKKKKPGSKVLKTGLQKIIFCVPEQPCEHRVCSPGFLPGT